MAQQVTTCPVLVIENDPGGSSPGHIRRCGEELQATVPVWFSDTSLEVDFVYGQPKLIDVDPGRPAGAGYEPVWPEPEGWRIYCANDHTEKEIMHDLGLTDDGEPIGT